MTQQVHAPSTRKPRLPGGCKAQDISRRIDIAVMVRSAIGTRPLSNGKRHFVSVAPAVGTGLTGGRKAVGDNDLASVPVCFVADLPLEFVHPNIGHRARQGVIFHHAADVQIFQRQDIGTANQGRGGLVQEVGSHRGDMGVNLGDPLPLFAPPVASFLHPTQPALLELQPAYLLFQMARIAAFRAVAGNNDILDTQVQTDCDAGQGQGFNDFLTRKRHEIAATGVFADRRHFRDTGRETSPTDFDKSEFRQLEEFAAAIGAMNVALVELIADGLLIPLRFEAGIFPALFKEIFERLVLVYQALRQAIRRRIRQPWEFCFLPNRHLSSERNVVVLLLALLPFRASHVQAAVPYKPRTTEFDRQLPTLCIGWREAEFVGALSGNHIRDRTISSTTQVGFL